MGRVVDHPRERIAPGHRKCYICNTSLQGGFDTIACDCYASRVEGDVKGHTMKRYRISVWAEASIREYWTVEAESKEDARTKWDSMIDGGNDRIEYEGQEVFDERDREIDSIDEA